MRGEAPRLRAGTARAVLGLALGLASPAAAAELETPQQIEDCFRANLPETSSIQTISLRAVDRTGQESSSRAKLYWKRFDDGFSRVMMRLMRPPDVRGSAVLFIEKEGRNDMFVYLPELGHTKRISSHMTSSGMFGTDFTYEEFERMQGLVRNQDPKRLEDAVVQERPVYVLEVLPGEEEASAYERIRWYIDKEMCVALRAEFFERGDEPRKRLSVDVAKVSREGEIWVPRETVMNDLLDETHTVLEVEEIAVGKTIARKIFSQAELERGR